MRLQAILIIAVFAIWFSSKNIYFIGDDFTLLTEQLVKPFSVFTISAQFIMPVFKAFLAFGGWIFGGSASGYHLLIVLFHIFNVLLFYRILLRFDVSPMASFVSALFWGTLPQYAESIYWITGSVHTFTLFFAFSSLMLFIEWHRLRKTWLLAASLFMAVLSFYTKETAVVLLFFIAAYLYNQKDTFKKAAKLLAPHLILFIVLIASNQIIRHSEGLSLKGYYTTSIADYLDYFCYYTLYNLFGFQVLPGLLISSVFLLFFIFILYSLRKTKFFVFIALYILSLLPFLIVGKAPQRYSYITSLWLIPPIVIAIKDYFLEQKNKILRFLVFPLVILFLLVSLLRLRIEYKDYLSFSEMHKTVVQKTEAFLRQNGLTKDAYYFFINEQSGWTPFLISKNTKGFKKLWAIRDKGVADLIYLDDLYNFCIRKNKEGDLYKMGTSVLKSDRKDALDAIKKDNYLLIRYDDNLGMIGAKFNEEGAKRIEAISELPDSFIPYIVRKLPDFKTNNKKLVK